MKIDAYGKLIEVVKENDLWTIYELGEGKKTRSNDVYIPEEYTDYQVIKFLEDLFHERATQDFPHIRILDE